MVIPSSTPGFFGSFTWNVPELGMTDSERHEQRHRWRQFLHLTVSPVLKCTAPINAECLLLFKWDIYRTWVLPSFLSNITVFSSPLFCFCWQTSFCHLMSLNLKWILMQLPLIFTALVAFILFLMICSVVFPQHQMYFNHWANEIYGKRLPSTDFWSCSCLCQSSSILWLASVVSHAVTHSQCVWVTDDNMFQIRRRWLFVPAGGSYIDKESDKLQWDRTEADLNTDHQPKQDDKDARVNNNSSILSTKTIFSRQKTRLNLTDEARTESCSKDQQTERVPVQTARVCDNSWI